MGEYQQSNRKAGVFKKKKMFVKRITKISQVMKYTLNLERKKSRIVNKIHVDGCQVSDKIGFLKKI